MTLLSTLKFITSHPLNRDRKLAAAKRFLAWQIGSRLVPGPVAVRFVNDARLLASPGMTGATGNVYAGLHEFEDMAFALHLLRPGDLFVDVGANIGSYTVLAATTGAHCVSFEPLPQTFSHLQANIRLNGFGERVQARNLGVGRADGVCRFTAGLDTVNHVASDAEAQAGATLEIPVVALDQALAGLSPTLLKIDVEGFEANVIAGAGRVLAEQASLDAVILELNGSGARYGFDEAALHRQMLDYGFATFTYSPFERALISLQGKNAMAGNTLYVKNLDRVRQRLADAAKFHVLDQAI